MDTAESSHWDQTEANIFALKVRLRDDDQHDHQTLLFIDMVLRLPVELRLKIKETILFWDLRTHAAFYLTHKAIAAMYDSASDPDEFWKRACWWNGLGILPDEEDKIDDLCWKNIALDCFLRDGFCDHPACGESMLKYNRAQMRNHSNRKYVKPYQAAYIRGEDNPTKLVGHRIFRWIAFRPSHDPQSSLPIRSYSVSKDAHLLHEAALDDARISDPHYHNPLGYEGDAGDENAREYLARHPLVARSFACFFPVVDISFCFVHDIELTDHEWYPEVKRPVTVLDVLGVLHLDLEHELELPDMRSFVLRHEQCLEEKGWGLSDALKRVRTVRDTFSACRLRELNFICIEEEIGPAFAFEQV